jgi:hypothetical protein
MEETIARTVFTVLWAVGRENSITGKFKIVHVGMGLHMVTDVRNGRVWPLTSVERLEL